MAAKIDWRGSTSRTEQFRLRTQILWVFFFFLILVLSITREFVKEDKYIDMGTCTRETMSRVAESKQLASITDNDAAECET